MPPALRGVFDTAKLSKGGSHAGRLLALAAMHDGATRAGRRDRQREAADLAKPRRFRLFPRKARSVGS